MGDLVTILSQKDGATEQKKNKENITTEPHLWTVNWHLHSSPQLSPKYESIKPASINIKESKLPHIYYQTTMQQNKKSMKYLINW